MLGKRSSTDHYHGEAEASPAPLTDAADTGHSRPSSGPTPQGCQAVTHSVHGQAWGLNGDESRPLSACQTTCLAAGLCPTAGVIYSAFRNALDGLAAVSLRAEPFNPPSSPCQVKNNPVQKCGCAPMVVCQKQP